MSHDIDRLMNNARNRLPGATDTAIQLELFNVLSEFFQESNLWTQEIEFEVDPTNDDPRTYYIEAESVASINRLMGLVDSNDSKIRAAMAEPGVIVLERKPTKADTYKATVALTVNDPVARDGFAEYPQWILNKYGIGLLEGVLARMMSQPAKPFSNTQLAAFHYRKFRNAVSLATNEAQHKNLSNAQAWRFPPF